MLNFERLHLNVCQTFNIARQGTLNRRLLLHVQIERLNKRLKLSIRERNITFKLKL